jgi:hypothetical protein
MVLKAAKPIEIQAGSKAGAVEKFSDLFLISCFYQPS